MHVNPIYSCTCMQFEKFDRYLMFLIAHFPDLCPLVHFFCLLQIVAHLHRMGIHLLPVLLIRLAVKRLFLRHVHRDIQARRLLLK